MDALQRFEELLENAVEGTLAEALAGHIQPVEMAKRLARAMDRGQTVSADGVWVPNEYTIHVSSSDYDALLPFRQALERELTAYLRILARERAARFLVAPTVAVMEDPSLSPRRMRVSACVSQAAPKNDGAPQLTAPLPVAEVQRVLQQPAHLIMPDGRLLPLDKAVISMGRNLLNDIVVEDPRVSRRHAQIRREKNAFCLYDLESTNGTLVNGEPVKQIVLRDGDCISLGGVEMIFRQGSQERPHGS